MASCSSGSRDLLVVAGTAAELADAEWKQWESAISQARSGMFALASDAARTGGL